jgi:hypothetical protein
MNEDLFTPEERRVLAAYRNPSKDVSRATRLSIQYLVGAGIFMAMALAYREPLFALVTYGTFVVFVLIRLLGGRKLASIVPAILAKYEARVEELERKLAELERGA